MVLDVNPFHYAFSFDVEGLSHELPMTHNMITFINKEIQNKDTGIYFRNKKRQMTVGLLVKKITLFNYFMLIVQKICFR